MFSGGPALAAPTVLGCFAAQVSEARASLESLGEESRAARQRVTSMASRLAGMRARLEAQQQKMAKMQVQLNSITALIGKVTGAKVLEAKMAAVRVPEAKVTTATASGAKKPAPVAAVVAAVTVSAPA